MRDRVRSNVCVPPWQRIDVLEPAPIENGSRLKFRLVQGGVPDPLDGRAPRRRTGATIPRRPDRRSVRRLGSPAHLRARSGRLPAARRGRLCPSRWPLRPARRRRQGPPRPGARLPLSSSHHPGRSHGARSRPGSTASPLGDRRCQWPDRFGARRLPHLRRSFSRPAGAAPTARRRRGGMESVAGTGRSHGARRDRRRRLPGGREHRRRPLDGAAQGGAGAQPDRGGRTAPGVASWP